MPATPHTPPLPRFGWTAEQLGALPWDDGVRYECIAGELFVTPSPRQAHQAGLWTLVAHLLPYVEQHHIGKVRGAPADIRLDPQTLVQPDLYVQPPGIAPNAPWREVTSLLLVVEVLSPSTARADRRMKRAAYQRAGIPVYWIIDLDARLVEVWEADAIAPRIVDDVLRWAPRSDVPAFELDLALLFEESIEPPSDEG